MKLAITSNVAKKEYVLPNGSRLILFDVLGMASVYEKEEGKQKHFSSESRRGGPFVRVTDYGRHVGRMAP